MSIRMNIPKWENDASILIISGQIATVTERLEALKAEYETRKNQLSSESETLASRLKDLELGLEVQKEVSAQDAKVAKLKKDFESFEKSYTLQLEAKESALDTLQSNLETAIKRAKVERLTAIKTALLELKTENYDVISSALDKLKEIVTLEITGMQESGFGESYKCKLYQMELNRVLAIANILLTKFDYSAWFNASNDRVFQLSFLTLSGNDRGNNWKNGDDMPEYNPE